ncbi:MULTISPECIES: sugar ABC transporter ATP-binding protein [Rhizobium]|uniref:Ribose transport system ATP-binding protein n=1 Tax=Rhizobium esperanzae TaxID=1967781 RepID=A0A7W6UL17_9HYPH|nr:MULTISPECIES: sugar ABC transporter ATP-binding protein [Rhizobium]MBB4440100.1 ribose transport system ATP-binding protein [Rhizobium esperanzae]MDH6202335.1 ribose transport system ATP-binding protein [Rhizobium leguminosarum]
METLVELIGIRKSFGGVHALKGVDFALRRGEVHALLGENGAGKSTLMRVLGGEYAAEGGCVKMAGNEQQFRGPVDALDKGIAIIHQEMALATDLTVAENIFLSEIPSVISWRDLNRRAAKLIASLGFSISPSAVVSDLSLAHQQVVEIAKALSRNANVMVFDEPTAVLSVQDAERLLGIIRTLRDRGVGVIYISHRLDEVFRIADRITVMKDGASVATVERKDVEIDDVIRMMVGRSLKALFGEDIDRPIGEEVLRIEKLSDGGRIGGVSLSIKAGEIVGLGGLVGAGRTELVRMIFGAEKAHSGMIFLHGRQVHINNPRAAVKAGIGLVPESRKEQGLVLDFPIRVNATMSRLDPLVNLFGFVRRAAETETVENLASRLRIKAGSLNDPASSLSGGNQQKVVLAKWFHADGDLLIFDEPTRGVDVGAKTEIYSLIKSLAAEGRAVLVISSEHIELFGLCDRILVMREGELTGSLHPEDYTEEKLLKLAMVNTVSQAEAIATSN